MISSNIYSFLFLVTFCSFSGLGYSLLINKFKLLQTLISAPILSFIILSQTTANFSIRGYSINNFSHPVVITYFLLNIIILGYIFFKHKNKITFLKSEVSILLLVFAFSSFNSLIILSPVIKHNSWYFYNDHTTYIAISEYLQNHSYVEKADAIKEPWSDNMLMYQLVSGRMGAQYFLGLAKSITGVNHTIEIYPSVASFSEYLFIMSLSLISLYIIKNKWFLMIFLSIITCAVSLNQWIIMLGFLPQAFGLVISAFLVFNILRFIKFGLSPELLISNTISTAALILIYQEIMPFFVLSSALVYIYLLLTKRTSIKNLTLLLLSYILALLVSPTSSALMFKGIISQYGAIVGWNQKTSLMDYYLMLFGLDFYNLVGPNRKLIYIPGIVISIFILYTSFLNRVKSTTFKSILIIGSFYIFILIIFRFIFINPFDKSIGNTWNIYKVIQWTYWVYILVISYNIYNYFKINKTNKYITYLFFCTLAIPFYSNFKIFRFNQSTFNVVQTIGGIESPLKQYSDLILDVKKNMYSPANLFFDAVHPYVAYLPLTILKENSKGVFLTPNDSMLINHDQNSYIPDLSNKFYQWIYFKNEQASNFDKLTQLVGFNIYPPKSSIAYFLSGFNSREFNGNLSFSQMVTNNSEIRLAIKDNVFFISSLTSNGEGVVTVKTDKGQLLKKLYFTKNNLLQNLYIPFSPGFYRIYINWIGETPLGENNLRFSGTKVITQ